MTTKKAVYVAVKGRQERLFSYCPEGIYYLKVGDKVKTDFHTIGCKKITLKEGGTVSSVGEDHNCLSGACVSITFKKCPCCGHQDPEIREVDATYAIPLKVRRSIPKERKGR
jgi:hypothetical protein